MRRRWGLAVLVGAAACASLDGLTGGAPSEVDAGAIDAGFDAGTDVAETGSEPTKDASIDVVLDLCEANAGPNLVLCTTFDDPDADVEERWAAHAGLANHFIGLDGSVRFDVAQATNSDAAPNVYLRHQMDASIDTFERLEVAATITVPEPNYAPFSLIGLTLSTPGVNYAVYAASEQDRVVFTEVRPKIGAGDTLVLRHAEWNGRPSGERFRLVLVKSDTGSTKWRFQAMVDDAVVVDVSVPLEAYIPPVIPYVFLGAYSTAGPAGAIYDDAFIKLN